VFDRAIEIDPFQEVSWYNKGIALHALHRDGEADAAFRKAEELKCQRQCFVAGQK
jgi:Flp pilus assembly protein TadD